MTLCCLLVLYCYCSSSDNLEACCLYHAYTARHQLLADVSLKGGMADARQRDLCAVGHCHLDSLRVFLI